MRDVAAAGYRWTPPLVFGGSVEQIIIGSSWEASNSSKTGFNRGSFKEQLLCWSRCLLQIIWQNGTSTRATRERRWAARVGEGARGGCASVH
jgi:hypothetical protein